MFDNNTKPRFKVKLTTTTFRTKSGVTQQKSLYFYKKPCSEHLEGCFKDDVSNSYGLETLVINLNEVKDGIYELLVVNISKDYETGWVDDWDWKLIEWKD